MDPDHVGHGDRAEPKRIIVPKVRFHREGELGHVFKFLEISRFHAFFIECLLVERDLVIYPFDSLLQFFELKGLHPDSFMVSNFSSQYFFDMQFLLDAGSIRFRGWRQ